MFGQSLSGARFTIEPNADRSSNLPSALCARMHLSLVRGTPHGDEEKQKHETHSEEDEAGVREGRVRGKKVKCRADLTLGWGAEGKPLKMSMSPLRDP